MWRGGVRDTKLKPQGQELSLYPFPDVVMETIVVHTTVSTPGEFQ